MLVSGVLVTDWVVLLALRFPVPRVGNSAQSLPAAGGTGNGGAPEGVPREQLQKAVSCLSLESLWLAAILSFGGGTATHEHVVVL